MNKKIIGLVLILLMGSIGFAMNKHNKEIISEDQEESEYITYSGRISEVIKDKEKLFIIVEESSKGLIKFNINRDTVVLNNKTQDYLDREKLKNGDIVEVSYRKDEPMTKSLPPMTNASVIVVKETIEENVEITKDRIMNMK